MPNGPSFETLMYIVAPLVLLVLAIGLSLLPKETERRQHPRTPDKEG